MKSHRCSLISLRPNESTNDPELSVAVDVMFPDATFTHAVAAFQKEFPATLPRFVVESSAVIEPVLDGRCAIGVVGHGRSYPATYP